MSAIATVLVKVKRVVSTNPNCAIDVIVFGWQLYAYLYTAVYKSQSLRCLATYLSSAARMMCVYPSACPFFRVWYVVVKALWVAIISQTLWENFEGNHVVFSTVRSFGGPYLKPQEMTKQLATSATYWPYKRTVFTSLSNLSTINKRYSFPLDVLMNFPRISIHTDSNAASVGNNWNTATFCLSLILWCPQCGQLRTFVYKWTVMEGQ